MKMLLNEYVLFVTLGDKVQVDVFGISIEK